ncbi:hypothetical protein ACJ73_08384 [Blastomyces percursus]|uniref:Myb/SANT-like domain-containing protein n=1 Tax=Blastomyces percursus TaxID=1658174 RepID=A0A1J9QY84_9EURO|nr:hypothetical protein ACJ73_08384 [Blastomyces percursus]
MGSLTRRNSNFVKPMAELALTCHIACHVACTGDSNRRRFHSVDRPICLLSIRPIRIPIRVPICVPICVPIHTQSAARIRVSWSPSMDEAMLQGLLDAKKDGWETENGNFKTYGWNMAIQAVQSVNHQMINKNTLDSRWRHFKRTWRLWMKHKNQISGWTWCAERGTYINDPEGMEEYFQRHLDMRLFQRQGPPFRELNEQLLDGKLATGQYAVGSQAMRRQLDTDDDLSYSPSSPTSNALASTNDLP